MKRLVAILCLAVPLSAQTFTAELWLGIQPIYEKTIQHPFLRGLSDGSLPRDRFEFYLLQDGLYLRRFSAALTALASKAPNEQWALTLAKHSVEAIEAERQFHEKVLASYGVSKASAALVTIAPANLAYTNHLLVSVDRGSFTEGLAALLPCYWIYQRVGQELVKRGSRNPDYQRWIDQYAGDDYAKSVQQVLSMMNEASSAASPAERAEAKRLFTISARYEYMFWDMAWRLQQWEP